MITIEIVAAGKIKDEHIRKAIEKYKKRLGRYCNLLITEVPDFPDDKNSTERECALMMPKIKGFAFPFV